MQVEVFDTRTLSEADLRAIAELLVATWPNPEKTVAFRIQQQIDLGRQFADAKSAFPLSLLVREGERVVAHGCLVPRRIGTSAGEMLVAGLAKVCTDSTSRKKGLGATVVRAVFDLVAPKEKDPAKQGELGQENFRFALFQTTCEVQPFYEKLGACTVDNPVMNSQSENPKDSPFWDGVVMRYPAGEGWPTGEIDLQGPGY